MNGSTLSRREEFRKLKNDIKGSDEHPLFGIDVVKERQHAFLGAAQGRALLRRLIFDDNREGFEFPPASIQSLLERCNPG